MIGAGPLTLQKQIEMTDDDLETSAVISDLFDIMTKDTNILDLPTSYMNDHRQSRVVKFAQKYDFVLEIRTIKYQLQAAFSTYTSSARDPEMIFNVAILLDDHCAVMH
jgi:hypothetical protein